MALLLLAATMFVLPQFDYTPHDATARVTPEDFWDALSRIDPALRPTDIVIYPPHFSIQLISCTAHPTRDTSEPRYLYFVRRANERTAEERLSELRVKFTTAWIASSRVQLFGWLFVVAAGGLITWQWPRRIRALLYEIREKSIEAAAVPMSAPVPEVFYDSLNDGDVPPAMKCEVDPLSPQLKALPDAELLQPPESVTRDRTEYEGEFYPVARPKKQGFSLVELLVVLALIAVLATLLFPVIGRARGDANQIRCATNLRSIAQGILMYENENQGVIPASYSYAGQSIVDGQQIYQNGGYRHWSYFLYHDGSTANESFICPELDGGGLPPTNTFAANRLPGQITDDPSLIDEQVPRVAYTLNEALSPRNKFAAGFQGTVRAYHFVKASSIPHASSVILATEWGPMAARSAMTGSFYLYSHRPVHGFVGLDGTLEMYQLSPSVGYRRIVVADLDPDPNTAKNSGTRLDWVGRNHGALRGYPDERKSNFLYLDGHVEEKTVYDTLEPFQWGDRFYTLADNSDLQQ
jgi:prepilin-type N-terminal cleavage/methylation domain-containing protein/prepilin-type processing-associated H-X9-DG protein